MCSREEELVRARDMLQEHKARILPSLAPHVTRTLAYVCVSVHSLSLSWIQLLGQQSPSVTHSPRMCHACPSHYLQSCPGRVQKLPACGTRVVRCHLSQHCPCALCLAGSCCRHSWAPHPPGLPQTCDEHLQPMRHLTEKAVGKLH